MAPAFVFGLDLVDTLVTDAHADAGEIAAIEAQGVQVIRAPDTVSSEATA